MKFGAHVSIAGGIENSPERARELGADCFQIFTRSPHGGPAKKIEATQDETFKKKCQQFGYTLGQDYVVHTPYYINLASENNRIYYGSINSIRVELEAASLIESPYVITHLGSSKDLDGKELQKQINLKVMKALKKIFEGYSGSAQLVLEIAAGSGNIIGDTFEEISYFLKQMRPSGVKLGFCFDTCHSFAAGYDLRTPKDVEKTFEKLDKTIGIENLKVLHLNDSQGAFNSNVDRHEHLGQGKIGLKGLTSVINLLKVQSISAIIETKTEGVKKDIALAKTL